MLYQVIAYRSLGLCLKNKLPSPLPQRYRSLSVKVYLILKVPSANCTLLRFRLFSVDGRSVSMKTSLRVTAQYKNNNGAYCVSAYHIDVGRVTFSGTSWMKTSYRYLGTRREWASLSCLLVCCRAVVEIRHRDASVSTIKYRL